METINKLIQNNQEASTSWRYHGQARSANRVFATINANLFKGELPEPVIGFNNSGRLKKDGAYHWEGDGISLPHHIDLRQDLSDIETVVALIHNATHMSMEVYHESQYWYHSKEFRDTMRKFGIKTADNGDTIGFLKAFGATLEKLGRPDLATEIIEPDQTEGLIGDVVVGGDDTPVVDMPTLEAPAKPPAEKAAPKPGKNGKWACDCTKLVCNTELNAVCNNCGFQFKLVAPKETKPLELVTI
jgi:hypothetical protein